MDSEGVRQTEAPPVSDLVVPTPFEVERLQLSFLTRPQRATFFVIAAVCAFLPDADRGMRDTMHLNKEYSVMADTFCVYRLLSLAIPALMGCGERASDHHLGI